MAVCFTVLIALGISLGCSSTSEPPATAPAETRTPYNLQTIGLLIEPGPAADIGYRIGWASPIQLLPKQEITSVVALDDLVFVVESPKNVVTALKASDGELVWKVNLGSDIESLFQPSRDANEVYVHSASRFWTLNARTGEVTAVAPLASPVSSHAVYSPETRLAIMSGTDGLVFAHSVVSNFSRWQYRLANRITSSAVLAGQDVFVVDSGGTYAMLETANGNPLWRNRTLGPVGTQPSILGSEVVVASRDGKLYAINRTTGRDTWKYLGAEQPLAASPFALGRLIVQPLFPNEGIVAIDSINGEEIWRTDITANPVVTRQRDMLLHTDDQLLSIDLDDGELGPVVATLPLQTVVPVGTDGSILLVSPKGQLLKLTPQ
ncbi:MAG: PQQ-binding-like beta-propeller repeat protein [Phycisphaeraceae bacterium]